MNLQSKILMLVLPLVILPLFWLGWTAYTKLEEVSRNTSLGQMATTLDQVSRNVANHYITAQANTRLFAGSGLVKKYVLTRDEAERYMLLQAPLLRLFASYQQAYPEYYEIRILMPDGYEDTRALVGRLPNTTEMEADSEFFQHLQATGESLHEMYTINPDIGKPVLYIGKKLILRDDSFESLNTPPKLRGYLVISVSLDFLQQQLDQQPIGRNGYLFVTSEAGKPLLMPDGRSERALGEYNNALVQALALHDRALQTRLHDEDIYLQGRVLHHDLNLFAVLPEKDLLAASRELAIMVASITLLTIVLASALIVYVINHILVHPIQRLGRMAHEVGRSRFDARSGIDSGDEIGELARSFEEMSRNLEQSQEQVAYLAYRDSLTGMPNRRMFQEYLKRALAHAHRYHTQLALLFLDLDNFKQVNDTKGHQAGDRLLQDMAERLTECLRNEDEVSMHKAGEADEAPRDTLARLGGDEFLILLCDIRNPSDAANVARRIMKRLAAPFNINDNEFFISSSIGISVYPSDGDDVDTLIKNADIAMYHAKERGRNNYQYFNETMNIAAVERLNMENALRKAIHNCEFVLHYQPKVNMSSGEIMGVEALIRWQRPEMGLIPPMEFIPLAEESGLIVPIGEWVINEATQQMRRWQDDGIDLCMSINISTVQLNRQNVAEVIKRNIEQNRCRADKLEIELTETSIMDAYERAISMLNEIKSLGVHISMDDFGIGYSSFSYLRNLPLNILKIDRSFVCDITTDQEDATIVSAILAMAHTLDLAVVAEGVETLEQLKFLRQHRCDIVQGFLISRPLPEPELRRLLKTYNGHNMFDSDDKPQNKHGSQARLEVIRKD